MNKTIPAIVIAAAAFPAFCYEYKTEDFLISGGNVQSVSGSDKASVSKNKIHSNYKGCDFERTVKPLPENAVVTHDELIDTLTAMAFEEAQADINDGGYFVAGAKWPSAWTRDMSYAIDLSLGFLFPQASEKSLDTRVEDGIILQDTGSGGSYPVSTDRIVWARAAYSYALYKQDTAYFAKVYSVLSKTLEQDYAVTYDAQKKLFRGETSFLDWREQTYPRWMDSVYIGSGYALGTNIVFYSALCDAAELARKCGKNDEAVSWKAKADELAQGIKNCFWIDGKNYFGAYYIGLPVSSLYEGYETLGESLSVLTGIAPAGTETDVLSAVKPGRWGMSVVAPQLSGIKSYHNDAVWPFVQGYRCLALKKAGDFDSCEKEFASMVYTSSLFRTFRENFRASDCDMDGTELSSDRQLWSVGSWLSLMYKIVCGIDFTSEGLSVKPLVFDSLKNGVSLAGFTFAGNTLNLRITGTGNEIESCTVNGKVVTGDVLIPYGYRKKYDVKITMKKTAQTVKARDSLFECASVSPVIPSVNTSTEGKGVSAEWRQNAEEGWNIFRNNVFVKHTDEKELFVSSGKKGDIYTITAPKGNIPVLPGTPVRSENKKNTWFIEVEDSKVQGGTVLPSDGSEEKLSADLQPALNSGTGYVQEWGTAAGDSITFSFTSPADGNYLVDFRYNNGLGPINTGDKCAIRAVSADGTLVRRIPFPQLGSRSLWAFSEPLLVHFTKGAHTVTLSTDSFCFSQHHRLNEISVDMLRVFAVQ